jgi:hypothetical protein
MENNSRRSFFKTLAGFSGLALLAPHFLGSLAKAEEGRRSAAPAPAAGGAGDVSLPLVEPGKGMAESVKYLHKSSDKNKICGGCMLYTKVGKKGTDAVGKCSLFQGQLVKEAGGCNSWAKKA